MLQVIASFLLDLVSSLKVVGVVVVAVAENYSALLYCCYLPRAIWVVPPRGGVSARVGVVVASLEIVHIVGMFVLRKKVAILEIIASLSPLIKSEPAQKIKV